MIRKMGVPTGSKAKKVGYKDKDFEKWAKDKYSLPKKQTRSLSKPDYIKLYKEYMNFSFATKSDDLDIPF